MSLLLDTVSMQTIPYLPFLVALAALVYPLYEAIYKKNTTVAEKLTGIPGMLLVILTIALAYVDTSYLAVFGQLQSIITLVIQIVGSALIGLTLAVAVYNVVNFFTKE